MSAMKVATFNGCKVYNLTSGKALPQWLSENKKRGNDFYSLALPPAIDFL
jgi:hypothetical protein